MSPHEPSSTPPASPPRILVIVGPTASGKSALAARLGAALPGEVINADSVQIYRSFDIGSGKPDAAERALSAHHLLDVCDAREPLCASRFAALADQAITDILERGQVPIVCGGTFLWVRALLAGLAQAPPGDETLRAEHLEFAEQSGRAALHARLAEVDPASAARLHPNDFVRVSRALEVHQLTGERLSELHAAHGFARERYDAQLLGIAWPREEYDARVEQRVRQMFASGFVEEVRQLIAAGLGQTRAMDSVGYRQVRDAVLAGTFDEEELIKDVVRVTRIFARRQRTWLRDRDVRWLAPSILQESSVELRDLTTNLRLQLQPSVRSAG